MISEERLTDERLIQLWDEIGETHSDLPTRARSAIFARRAIAEDRAELEKDKGVGDAYAYASRLAQSLWSKHFNSEPSNWRPLPDLIGVLTQIDNMTCELRLVPSPKEAGTEWRKIPATMGDLYDLMERSGYRDKARAIKEDAIQRAAESRDRQHPDTLEER